MTRTIDPASLSGEALTLWYQRSPLELERARQLLANDRYDAFTGTRQTQPKPKLQLASAMSGPIRGQLAGALPTAASPVPRNQVGHVCASCHGPVALPPPMIPWPVWPMRPLKRDTPNLPPGEPKQDPNRERKQCEIQLQRDTMICNQQPNNAAKSVCFESSNNRYAHCRKTGEVGEPDLFTIPSHWRRD